MYIYRVYNKIPDRLKELPICRFKNRLKRWLLEKSQYSLKEFLD